MLVRDILKLAGFPQDYVVLDFETYYADNYSLISMQPWEYITDPRFEVLGCGTYYVGKEVKRNQFVWPDVIARTFEAMTSLYGENWPNMTVVVQNAQFDPLILRLIYGITPKFIIDVKHLAAHQDSKLSHRLKDLAIRNGLQEKGKTEDFKNLHFADMSVDKKRALSEYCENDCDLEQKLFEILLPRLSWPENELWNANHTLHLYLEPQIVFNEALALSLQPAMQTELDRLVQRTGFTPKQISGNKSIVKLFEQVLPPEEAVPLKQGKPTKEGLPNVIPALAKNDDGCNYLLAHPKKEVAELMEARLAIKSWPNHLKRMDKMKKFSDATGGFLPVPLNYYGSHTGRVTGGGKINLCNLGGSGRAGSGNHPLIKAMRGLLLAPAGKTFILCDSAQIEARLLAWIAKCTQLVTGFANKEDIYSEFATTLFGSPVRKPKSDDDPVTKQRLEVQRGFGKDAILGCGYGMGWMKFWQRCLENRTLRPMFDNGTYTSHFMLELVDTYRSKYPEIPAFWTQIEKMFRWVVKYPCEHIRYGKEQGFGFDVLQMWNDRGTVNVQLPSSRILFYPHSSVNVKDNTLRYEHGHLWGGTLTENVIQSIGRDLLMTWLRWCEEEGIHIVHHVYDELIGLVPMETADDDLAYMQKVMETTPEWAGGVPLGSEGKISLVYTK